MRKGKAQTLLSNQRGSQGTLGVGLSVAREERGFCSRAGAARGPASSRSAGEHEDGVTSERPTELTSSHLHSKRSRD